MDWTPLALNPKNLTSYTKFGFPERSRNGKSFSRSCTALLAELGRTKAAERVLKMAELRNRRVLKAKERSDLPSSGRNKFCL